MKITTFETGFFLADGGSVFGLLPKQIWMRHYPCDNQNLCKMTMRCMLVETNKYKILFDTGIGINNGTNTSSYNFHDLNHIASQLNERNISTAEITHVVLSHLHFDHCGALTYYDNNGILKETFHNATYIVGKAQYHHAKNSNILDYDSFIESTLTPLHNSERTILIENEFEICDGVKVSVFDGHTPGQLVGFIGKDKPDYIFAADVIPMVLNVRTSSISCYDLCSLDSANSKLRLLDIAKKNSSTIILYHDAISDRVKIKGSSPRYMPIVEK